MPTIPLCPSFDFLRKEAKDRLATLRKDKPAAKLAEAQHVLAKEYGFKNWSELKDKVGKSANLSLTLAAKALRAGEPVILYDDAGREDEGDFVYAAEKVTAQAINFLTKAGRGTICLALPPEQVDRLELSLMRERDSMTVPAFTVSIDAQNGITTGVSAADRAATVRAAVADSATAESVRSPGHIFPLRAANGGLAERQGHTEASIELVRRAGLKPAAVICEILNEDGSMARMADVAKVSSQLKIPLVKISELIH